MPHGPTYFPSKGACIYCNAKDAKLTDEHILPYSLGGFHVIREASCLDCADVTKKFEQKIARDLWGDARTSYDAPSRRKKDRQKFIHMSDAASPSRNTKVPVGEYPAGFVFYRMGLPGLLQGLAADDDVSNSWKFTVLNDDHRRNEFLKNNPDKKLTLKFRNVPYEFGRLLCKVGYGQLLTVFDLGDFSPICLPYIMGEKTNVSYIIGETTEKTAPIPGIGYSLDAFGLIHDSKLLLIAKVRLYANAHSPEYQVIVGEVIGDHNIRQILGKMGHTQFTEALTLLSQTQ